MENFAIYDTSFGFFKIVYKDHLLISLKKIKQTPTNFGIKSNFSNSINKQLQEYFERKRTIFNVDFELYGTDFQKKVWNELCNIPYGKTRSYKDIAIAIGNEKASRAIGMANNKNPISIIIPCHRVIGSNNKLVGYASGLDMKEKLLNLEKSIKF